MNANKKPRGDSLLKTLPSTRQADIFTHGQEHKLAETAAWLAEDGVKVSLETLSQFLRWYGLRSQFRQDEETTETLLEQLKQSVPGLTDEQLDELGQRTFSLLAIRRQDPETFVMVRSARTKGQLEKAKLALRQQAEDRQGRKLKLEIDKVELLAAEKMLSGALRAKADEINASSLSQADKIAAMRKAAFADVAALQASGKLKLPKA